MRTAIALPGRLVEAIRRRGHDVETLVIAAIEDRLELDPSEELETRLEIAKHMLRRGLEELERGDAVQASEKLYKAVEECIKILACLEELEECRVGKEVGWWTKLLSRAARKLSSKLGLEMIRIAWEEGYDLHVHGFREHGLGIDEVKQSVPIIEKLVEYTEKRLRSGDRSSRS